MKVLRTRTAVCIFLIPPLVLYLFAVFTPIVRSLIMSLYEWNGIFEMEFVGLQNYVRLFTRDTVFWQSLFNSAVFVAINLFIQLVIGLLLASLLTYVSRVRETIKTLYFVPSVITTVAIAYMFQKLYSYEPLGLINLLLTKLGLEHLATPWLSNLKTALVAVSVPEGWRFMGFYMIILYAALIAVPKEMEEAARIDGGTEWNVFRYVRFPTIRPVFVTTMIMATTYTLRGFDIPYLLTNGGPGHATELVTTYMYKTAFTNLDFGYASTIAVFIVMECVLAVALILRFRRAEGEELS
ncbi:carbohydrate ABC transporter permease [Geochorda subterranea]|uniref:Sugar ABC transporter permease n=1 Tax=Geochorda subterranea TaxID=3109564 RepID=A0ABZ1BPK5_9FIRM|nr:sugar ABC transporter permease [Limnochorda sp. LNt]WRP14543.1 sugar ABC transporter permease [Limnochorda sp. LNt]